VDAVGLEDAIKITNLEYNTMTSVHDFAKQHSIKCDNLRCQTVDVFYDEAQFKLAKASVALMEKTMGKDKAPAHIFHSPEQTAKKFLAPNSFGSVEYESGSLSAYKFTVGVLKLALAKGLNLQCNTPATSISKSSNDGKWTVATPRGTISTPKLVLTTNGYTAHLLPRLLGVIVPLRGVVTAQRPGKGLPQQGLETTFSYVYKEGYEYMISRPHGTKHEGDIVIGGGMFAAKDDGMSEYGNSDDTTYDKHAAKYLADCTKRYFGENWGEDHAQGRIRRTWSGVMGFSADGYPFIGPMPGEEGLFLSVSFQGHGMVLCFLCAKAVTSMILGQKEEEELKGWFPECYRISEERLGKKFMGRTKATGAPEPTSFANGTNGTKGVNGLKH
jgi:glycine/D-amino acid oxidase-like deaminating enzyme